MNSKIKKIYFRFDAGGLIGFGHLGRIEAISDTCKSMDIDPVWVIRMRPSLRDLKFKFEVIWLDENPEVTDPNPETWKSISETKEATDFLDKASDAKIVFIDHYALCNKFVQTLKDHNIKTVCVLDFIPDKFNCDFAINYNIGAEKELNLYQATNSTCTYFLGASFAPIKPILHQRSTIPLYRKKFEHIGIYLGGVSIGLHKKLLTILESIDIVQSKKIKWCISSEADIATMRAINTKLNIEYIGRQNTLLDFYSWTDLTIGASGVSFLERSYMGIPQALFKVAENQNDVVRHLPEEKLAFYVGDLVKENSDELIKKLNKINAAEIFEYATRAFYIYDGKGQKRFLEKILDKFNVAN